MRAGQLDREITIEKYITGEPDEYGGVKPTWQRLATVRAQIVQQSTEEFMRSFGASDETAIIFRIRWLDGVTPADRIGYQGRFYNLKEIKELGRRQGLELRCIALSGGEAPQVDDGPLVLKTNAGGTIKITGGG